MSRLGDRGTINCVLLIQLSRLLPTYLFHVLKKTKQDLFFLRIFNAPNFCNHFAVHLQASFVIFTQTRTLKLCVTHISLVNLNPTHPNFPINVAPAALWKAANKRKSHSASYPGLRLSFYCSTLSKQIHRLLPRIRLKGITRKMLKLWKNKKPQLEMSR